MEIVHPTIPSSGENEKPPSEEFPQLTDPTYWLSYEYQQIYAEVLQQRAAKEVKKKVNEILPSEVKKVVYSDLGQKILSQAGDTAFEKLGIKRQRPRKKTVAKRRNKGGAIVYPQHLVEQFGSGLVLK